jgi:aminotransferase
MIARHIEKLAPSGIRQFFDLVLGMPDVISLGVGEPDFISPWRVREKAITALEEGQTSYTSNSGLMILRKAIAEHFHKKYALSYKPEDEILITFGVSEALDLAVKALLRPRDKIIVVSPHYVAYPALPQINSNKVLFLNTKEKDHFKINPKDLHALVKQGPKAIILNYPCNPTGVSYNHQELKEIWRVLSKKEIVVISDEVYDELSYEGKHIPFACMDNLAKERTILLNGFSKGYAMTGFRSGYACGNGKIIQAMTKIHSYSALCTSIISQIASVEALNAQKEVAQMRNEYKVRRSFMVQELNRIGLKCYIPEGAFYCFPSIEKFKMKSLDFAKGLLFAHKVAVVPGSAFGDAYDDHLRMSYANTLDNLKEAIARMEKYISEIKK